MAVSFTNNFKNILDKLKSVLRTEFKGALPVFIGHNTKEIGNQYIRLDPAGSELNEYSISSEMREFTVNMYFYYSEPNINEKSLDQGLRITSRIEALIHDNMTMTLADSTESFNCRVQTTDLNALEDENEYVVQFVWRGQHLGNTG